MKMQYLQKSVLISTILLAFPIAGGTLAAAKGPGGGTAEAVGNNLSFPVIWAEGVTMVLRGDPEMPVLNGTFWYQWGTNGVDPNVTPASCPPDPDEDGTGWYCDDYKAGLSIPAGTPAAENSLPLAKAYLQKDQLNTWQAGTANALETIDPVTREVVPVHVNWIDWGDNLESVDWYIRSQVRIEVVLFKDLTIPMTPMTEYEMRHTSGLGIDEVHGLATIPEGAITEPEGLGQQATIFTPCARLAIQKLAPITNPVLQWDPAIGEWTGDINPSIYQAKDGTDNYTAEINVKGRIIYGYTWTVGLINDTTGGTAAGVYRITFSLDKTCGTVQRNTTFEGAKIIVPLEEEIVAAALAVETTSTDEGGGVAQLDSGNELTYIDVRILDRTGGRGGSR